MKDNSKTDSVSKGWELEVAVKECLEKHYKKEFELHPKIKIGDPPKEHAFDIASRDGSVVVECKRIKYTESGNTPSGKIAGASEAVLLMSFLPEDCEKLLVFSREVKEGGKTTLAKYYLDTRGSFLRGVKVMEFDMDTKELCEVQKGEP